MQTTDNNINGTRVERRGKNTILIPLPRALWRSCGTCGCDFCKGGEGFWDTVAVAAKSPKPGEGTDTAWTVHAPELHR